MRSANPGWWSMGGTIFGKLPVRPIRRSCGVAEKGAYAIEKLEPETKLHTSLPLHRKKARPAARRTKFHMKPAAASASRYSAASAVSGA
jgi:hypothetical protein